MKKALFLFIFCLALGILNAQQHYQFRTPTEQGLHIESSTADGLRLHYALSGIDIDNIDNGDAKGQEIILKGSFGSFAEGLPNLPFENRYVAVPTGATVNVTVKEKATQTLSGIDLLPAAPVQGNAAIGMPKLHKDMSVFGKDEDYPAENVCVAQTTTIRGLDVVLLSVTPFRYNPIRKTLEVIYDMEIDIRFEGGNGQFGEARYRNPDWDGILRDLVINSDVLPEAHYFDLLNEAIKNREEGCEYLIISPDDDSIVAMAETLKQFRTKQGILTKVVTTTECGGNEANAIKGYIQNAYEHWTIPPAAVMLFSGVDTLFATSTYYAATSGIPGFCLLFKNYSDGYGSRDYYYSSDNPYADMNGDSIPDLALSRLPALTLEEYRTQMDKLIQYETNPPTLPEYYNQPIITSGYEYNKWFLLTSQNFNGFCRKKLGKNPKNFYMVYNYTGDYIPLPDTEWSTGYNTNAVVDYFGPNGQNYIAQHPDTLNDWRDMDDYSFLVDALNKSSFLTLYRDHSSYDLWCCPWMHSHEIKTLTNTDPTFVISIGCDAALYSNFIFYETNNYQIYYGEQPMVAEFCKAKTGALGGIGSVTVTHSHFNDILTWGFIDNLWADFMPTLGTLTQPEFKRPAYALVAGKLFLNQHAFLPSWWPTKITTTHNVFHYLGEAYLNLYTEVPQPLAIEANSYSNDLSQYAFTAEEGALICLSYGDEILAVTQATGQPQTIAFSNLPIGAKLCLTATKQNCIRFEKDVTLILQDQPFVYVKDFLLNSHDDNGQLDAGESADIDIILHNYNPIASDQGTLTLTCESPFVEVVQNTATYQPINPEATVTLKKAFRITISHDAPDQMVLQFNVQFDENLNTHEDHFKLPVSAPSLVIDPEYRLCTINDEPSTHIIPNGNTKLIFHIINNGHLASLPLKAHLDIKAPFVHIEEPIMMIDAIAPNEDREISFLLRSDNETAGAWVQTSFDLQDKEFHHHVDTILQFGGIFENFETDTLNTEFNWRNNGNNPWSYSQEDAYEGQRCFMITGNTAVIENNTLKAVFKGNVYLKHMANISFRYKTSENDLLGFVAGTGSDIVYLNNTEWSYSTMTIKPNIKSFNWGRYILDEEEDHNYSIKIDDICFPPKHRIIANAGPDLISCSDIGLMISDAYAYDCDTLYWTTEGDGTFEQDYEVNPTYYPGTGDLQQGEVLLTLHAISKTDTVTSSTTLYLQDEISISAITGDSIVNIFTQPISHYSVDKQKGINYQWKLEPEDAGWIYTNENEIDILWNTQKAVETSTLSVSASNSCEATPSTLQIHLIGHSTEEWHFLNVTLFPNPTDGLIHLVIGETLPEKTQVEVFNLMGARILTFTKNNLIKGEQFTIDLSSFRPGLYVVKLSTAQGNYFQKVSLR